VVLHCIKPRGAAVIAAGDRSGGGLMRDRFPELTVLGLGQRGGVGASRKWPRLSLPFFGLALAGLVVAVSSQSTSAYQVFVDLNTYSLTLENSALSSGSYSAGTNAVSATSAFAGADGVWLIEQNSGGISSSSSTGFTLSNWQTMIGNIAGPNALVSTEDNPPATTSSNGVYTVNNQNTSYTDTDQILGVTGYGTGTSGFTYVDAMSYNETGALTGGTLLTPSQINGTSGNGTSSNPYNVGEAATHGNLISVLTRGYGTDSNNNGITFQGATNTDLALSNVPAAAMETTSFDGENVIGFVNACYAANKRCYIYIGANYEDARVIPWMYELKQQAPTPTASNLVNIIINNAYNTTNSAEAYGWYGGDGSVQDSTAFAIAYKNVVPVTTYVWNSTSSGTISSTSNWSPQILFPYFNNKTSVAMEGTYPSHSYDAMSFSNGTFTGNITATVDTTGIEALGVYFAGSANYTLASSASANVVNLTSYGTLGASGDVGYGVNVIPIQVAGTGSNSISAPIVLSNTNAVGLTIDQQDTTNPFTVSGTLTTASLPIAVQGAGATVLSGLISGATALNETGTGVLSLGGTGTNSGVVATVSSGTLDLNASGSGTAAAAIADIASGAHVVVTGASATQLLSTYSGANLTINSGGTFDVHGNTASVTALAGTSGFVINNGPAAGTIAMGSDNQSGSFAGSVQDGSATLNISKSGTGVQTLSGSNAYSGTTMVSAGDLDFTSTGALPSNAGTVTVSSGATVELDAPNGSTVSLATPFNLGGTGASGERGSLFLNNGKIATYTLSGGITLNGAVTIGSYGVNENLNLTSAIGGSGSLSFNDEGGAVNSHSFNVTFGAASTYSGSTTLESGNANQATFKIGAASALPSTTVVTMDANAGNLTLNVNGQTQSIAGLISSGTPAHEFVSSTGGTLTINNSTSCSYGGAINGTLALVKNGSGAQTLSGSNGYTGATTISGGTLQVNGSLANTTTTVGLTGTLGGIGTIGGAVTSSGTISPGTGAGSAGTIQLNSGLTLSAASSLAFDLGTSTGSDKILTTSLTLNPSLQCVVATGTSFTTGNYAVVDYTGTLTNNSLNFSGWVVTGLPGAAQYHFAEGTDTSNSDNAIVLDVTVAPEPGSVGAALLSCGLLLRRRRR
jgi:autotransporter-associated beta strand protein